MTEKCILLLIKAPSSVKTETKAVTPAAGEKETDKYVEMAKETFRTAKRIKDISKIIIYERSSKYPDLRWLDSDDPGFLDWRGRSKTDELTAGIKWAFDAGAKRVVILPLNNYNVPEERIHDAFRTLETSNVVMGFGRDGTYYLLGMTGVYKPVIEEYSDDKLRPQKEILDRLKKAYMNIQVLPELETAPAYAPPAQTQPSPQAEKPVKAEPPKSVLPLQESKPAAAPPAREKEGKASKKTHQPPA